MPPAARLTDMHVCPMVTGIIPHVGGPIVAPGEPTVLIGFLPAARATDQAICVGPPDMIAMGSPTVLIGSLMAARIGDPTEHGGTIVLGCFTVMIGEAGSAGGGAGGMGGIVAGLAMAGVDMTQANASVYSKAGAGGAAAWHASNDDAIKTALKNQKEMLENKKAALARWNDDDKADFKKWFGSTDDASKKKIEDRIDKELKLNARMTPDNFKPADPPTPSTFAYVYPNDGMHTIYLDGAWDKAPDTGKDSKAGTLCHEMSHFNDIGGTKDHVYGADNAKALATSDPDKALTNADSFEYYVEGAP
jgi:uncharacterized Zn-binding protein involved in type VI secretion